ncbi:uncharacterized protein LOC110093504 [Dendrobium catenatum]|uniref:uncharacterized protein LOC110093504 n=1 Tax=Dendrobium catenatum TaxID=906689 RepID=UPI0009F49627|nr:uncharacterized protein LOC110093504 [Dendrobium catenatum]
MSFSQFPIDDRDLDDAELWDVIDSAAASRSRRMPLAIKNSSPASNPSPMPPKLFQSAKNYLAANAEEYRVSTHGEVVQEERWALARPQKMARFVEPVACGDHNRMVVVRHPSRTPLTSSPSYPPPSTGKFSVKEVRPIIESPKMNCQREDEKDNFTHSLSGSFPSVSMFKQYQNAAMEILEKTDYTMIRGNPFIKKAGWRKISFFFNISFEIRDKNIEYDDNRNVIRAEFLVRAFMQGGRFSDGWGSCDRREKHLNKPNHDIPSTAETRAKNKACQDLLGIGEYRPGVKM